MVRLQVLLILIAALTTAAAATTLDDLLLEEFQLDALAIQEIYKKLYYYDWRRSINSTFGNISSMPLPLAYEIVDYVDHIHLNMMSELASSVGRVTLQSLLDDLNRHCAPHLWTSIKDIRANFSDVPCVINRLMETLASKLQLAVDAGLQNSSRACAQQSLALCRTIARSCTMAYEQRLREIFTSFIQDDWELDRFYRSSPLTMVGAFFLQSAYLLLIPMTTASKFLLTVNDKILRSSSSDVLQIAHVNLSNLFKDSARHVLHDYNRIYSQEKSTGGIVESETGRLDSACSIYRYVYPGGSQKYFRYHYDCFIAHILQSGVDLLSCAYKDLSAEGRQDNPL